MINPKSILIVRTDRIGDVVLSLPLAGIIKNHYPGCRVTFLLREYTKPLAEGNPMIDEVLVLKEKKGKIELTSNINMLRGYDFDWSILVYPTFRASFILYMSSIPERIGSGYRWYSFLFNHRIFDHRKYAERHELEFNVKMLSLIGIREDPDATNIAFNITAQNYLREIIGKTLFYEGADLDKPLIIVHPGSGGSAVDLPVGKMRTLIEKITCELQVKVILTGTADEKKICEELSIPGMTINLSGKYNLNELIALISLSSIFIANSTGPLHIAAAMGKHVIGFYPKIKACSPDRWGPYTSKKKIFTPKIDCTNCTREQCVKLDCMNTIDVQDIFTELVKMYNFISK